MATDIKSLIAIEIELRAKGFIQEADRVATAIKKIGEAAKLAEQATSKAEISRNNGASKAAASFDKQAAAAEKAIAKELAAVERAVLKAEAAEARKAAAAEKTAQRAEAARLKAEQKEREAAERAAAKAEATAKRIAEAAERAAQRQIEAAEKAAAKAEAAEAKKQAAVEKAIAKEEAARARAAAQEQAEIDKAAAKVEQAEKKKYDALVAASNKARAARAKEAADAATLGLTAGNAASKAGKAAKEAAGDFGGLGDSIKGVLGTAADLNQATELLGKAFSVVGNVLGTFKDGIKNVIDTNRAYDNLSQTFNASKELVAALDVSFQKLGEGVGSSRGALSQFSGFLGDALKDDTSEAAKALQALGVNLDIVRASSKPFDEALKQIAATTQGVTLTLEQARAASLAFGEDDASRVIPVLNDLAGALDEVSSKKLLLDPEQAAQAKELQQTIGDLITTIQGLTTQFFAEFIPSTQKSTETVQGLIDKLRNDPEFVKGFNALKDVLLTVAGKDIPAVIEGIGRIVGLLGTVNDKVVFFGEVLRGLPTAGISTLEEALNNATVANDKLKVAIFENNQFLKIYNETANEAERQQKANALATRLYGEQIKTHSAELQKNTKATEENIAVQIQQLGSVTGLAAKFNELKDAQKAALEKDRLDAEQKILDIKQQQVNKEQELTDVVKAANAERIADALATGDALSLIPGKQLEAVKTAADQISEINSGLAQKQIDNANAIIERAREESEERRKAADELINKIVRTETDIQQAKQQTATVVAQLNTIQKAIDAEILAAQKQKVEGEKKLQQEVENSEKRKAEAVKQAEKEKAEAVKQAEKEKTDAAKEEQEKRDELLEKSRLEQTALIKQLIEEDKAAGVSAEETAIKVAQIKISSINQQIDAKQKEVEKLREEGAEQSAILEKENEILRLKQQVADIQTVITENVRETAQATQQIQVSQEAANKSVEKLADKANSASGAIEATAGKVVGLKVTFDAATASVEELRQRIADLRADGDDIANGIAIKGALNGRIAIAQSFYDTANALEVELQRRIAEGQAEAQRQANEERQRQVEELVDNLTEIEERRIDALDDLERDHRRNQRELNDQRDKENEDYRTAEEEATRKLFEDEDKLSEAFYKKQRERQEEEARQAVILARETEKQKRDAIREEQSNALEDEEDFLVERSDLRKKISDLEKEAATDPEKKKELENARAELAKLEQKEAQRKDREARKQAALEKARAESKNSEEFDARKAAIDAQFEQEEEFQDQLDTLRANGDTEAIKDLEELNRKKQKLIQDQLAAELAEIAAQEKDKQDQRDREGAAEQAAFDQAFKDLQDAYAKQKSERDSQHQERLDDIDREQDEERQKFKNGREKIEQDARDSFTKVGAAMGIAGDAFDALIAKLKAGQTDIKAIADAVANLLNAANSAVNSGPNNSGTNPSGPGGTPSQQAGVGSLNGNAGGNSSSSNSSSGQSYSGGLGGATGIRQQPGTSSPSNNKPGSGGNKDGKGNKPGSTTPASGLNTGSEPSAAGQSGQTASATTGPSSGTTPTKGADKGPLTGGSAPSGSGIRGQLLDLHKQYRKATSPGDQGAIVQSAQNIMVGFLQLTGKLNDKFQTADSLAGKPNKLVAALNDVLQALPKKYERYEGKVDAFLSEASSAEKVTGKADPGSPESGATADTGATVGPGKENTPPRRGGKPDAGGLSPESGATANVPDTGQQTNPFDPNKSINDFLDGAGSVRPTVNDDGSAFDRSSIAPPAGKQQGQTVNNNKTFNQTNNVTIIAQGSVEQMEAIMEKTFLNLSRRYNSSGGLGEE